MRAPLFLLVWRLAIASPFDPHRTPHLSSPSFFDGWFTRVVDHTNNLSFSVIFGSFKPAHSSTYNNSWVALLYSAAGSTAMVTEQHFVDQADVQITPRSSSNLGAASSFIWESPLGSLAVNDSSATLAFHFKALRLRAELSHRVPWSNAAPNSAGPEGWPADLPFDLLPCHYYVHTLASQVNYTLEFTESQDSLEGAGFGHMETNYGKAFPSAWIWAEGISPSGQEQLLLSSIKLPPAKANFLAYRSRKFAWDFRSFDLDSFRVSFDSEAGWISIVARRVFPERELLINMTAAPRSFSDPLYVPTRKGWSDNPGSVESYIAHASVVAYQDGSKVEVLEIPLAALEFGGDYRSNAQAVGTQKASVLFV